MNSGRELARSAHVAPCRLFFAADNELSRRRSKCRSTETVIHANEGHVDVLSNAVALEGHAGRRGKADRTNVQEEVIVLDAHRPVRRKPEFEASANRATPTCLALESLQHACAGCAGCSEDVIPF